MKNITTVICLLYMCIYSYGQKCTHTNLSKKYNFITSVERQNENECDITLTIVEKLTKVLKHIIIHSDGMLKDDYINCDNVRSYVTNVNNKLAAEENDYGDLIIADFNFDGKEDIALKRESVGNGGPIYKFYTQNNKFDFVEDKYLTQTVMFFPEDFDTKLKALITNVRANTYQKNKITYQLDVNSGKWKIIKSIIY